LGGAISQADELAARLAGAPEGVARHVARLVEALTVVGGGRVPG